MSMLNAATPYRRGDRQQIRVPVVLPLVEVDVDERGYLSVRLDREPYSADDVLTRDDLNRVIDDIAADLGTAVRVQVHEADGSTFTDIVTPTTRSMPDAPGARTAVASPFGICADGFTAGEPVEVCLVVAHQIAGEDGTTHLRLPPALLDAHPQVVLLGRTSGVVALALSESEP